jgi:hypothetical protein
MLVDYRQVETLSYQFPESERRRYIAHGVARIPLGKTSVLITLDNLPGPDATFFWLTGGSRSSDPRRIIVASSHSKTLVPPRAKPIKRRGILVERGPPYGKTYSVS